MRKLLLLFGLILIFPALAKGQGYLYTNIALNQNGRPIPSPTVTVCAAGQTSVPCTSLVTVYSDAALTVSVTNPLPICTQTFQIGCADVYGNYSFYIAPGTYTYSITGQGTTLQGPFVITIPCVVGSSCGGGGSVGPGTVNQVAEFGPSATTIRNSSITDDGTNPSRIPNGANSAGGGFYAEWVVDTGGVTANKLACRSSNNKAVICPAGTTQGVLGVAQATVSAGGTALVCFAGKCNVISTNATTAGHWLIPSASVAGNVDDTGSTAKPTNAVQTVPAETSVSGGNAVLTTFLSPDTLNSATAGTGSVNPAAQYSSAYYSAPGSSTTISGTAPPTANGRYFFIYDVSANAAVQQSTALAGVSTRTVSGTTDTLLYSDRAGLVDYTSNSAVAVTVPQAGSTGFTSNTVFKTRVRGSGAVTFTPTTSTVNGSATLVQNSGQVCTWYSDNTNYRADCTVNGSAYATIQDSTNTYPQRTILKLTGAGSAGANCADDSGNSRTICTLTGINGPPSPTVNYISGSSYTIQNSDNSWRDSFTNGGAVAVTLPQAGQISSAAFVGNKIVTSFTNCASNTCTTPAYSQSNGNYTFIQIGWTSFSGTSLVSFSDSAGSSCSRLEPDLTPSNGGAVYFQAVIVCKNIPASGSNTFTYVTSDNPFLGVSYIQINEYTIASDDKVTSASTGSSTTPISTTVAVSFSNEIALSFTGMSGSCASGWTQRSTRNGTQSTCERLLSQVSSVSYLEPGGTTAATVLADYGVSGQIVFAAGWYVILENLGTAPITVTPTVSTINGRSTLVMLPNESCAVMSDGTNYNAICGFIPNQQTNGVVGGSVTMSAAPQTAGTSSIGATTLLATPSAPVSNYLIGGYADVTVVGTSCVSNTTVVLNAIYTDPSGSGTTTRALGTFTVVNNGTAGDNFGFPMTPLRAKGSTNIQFSTTYTAGGSCSPAPTVQVTPILQVM